MSRRKTIILGLLLFSVLFYLFIILLGYYNTELDKKPIVKENLDNYTYLYDFYISNVPNTVNYFIGDENAPIDIVVYLDPLSEKSIEFMNSIYNILEKDYIYKGKVRYFPKYFITLEDYNNKTKRYKILEKIECLKSKHPEEFPEIYKQLFSSDKTESLINTYFHSYNMTDCQPSETLKEMLSENVNYGIAENPRIYIGTRGRDFTILKGIPSERKLRRTLKNYEMIVGYAR